MGSRSVDVHRCRFFDVQPAAINAIAWSASSQRAAVSRSDNDIEIWSRQPEWHISRRIVGSRDLSVEALAFTPDGRLFSAGHHASVVEWDLTTLAPRVVVDSYGGAVWSLSVSHNGALLAVGCEDGSVRVFDIADGRLTYQRTLEVQKGRVLSLSWSHNDRALFAGTAKGHVRKYSITTGRVLLRISVDTSSRQDRALVWSVQVLPDGTVVSGDALGQVQFWDGELGTLLQVVATHEADVLSVVASADGSAVFASGIDSKVVQLVRSPDGARWLITAANRAHTHDVRALCMCGPDLLLSGGVDTQLITHNPSEFRKQSMITRLNPLRASAASLVSLAPARRVVALLAAHHLFLYRLGDIVENDDEMMQDDMPRSSAIDLDHTSRRRLAEISLKGARKLTCGGISPNGTWAVAGDGSRLRLFRVHYDAPADGVRLERVQHEISELDKTEQIVFTPDGNRIIAVTGRGAVLIVDLSSMQVVRRVERPFDSDAVRSLAVSADGQWVAVGDCSNTITVHSLEGTASVSLPIFDTPHTALAFHPERHSLLVVAGLQGRVNLYDIEERKLLEASRDATSRLQAALSRTAPGDRQVMSITFNPADLSSVIVMGLSFLCKVDIKRVMVQQALTAATPSKQANKKKQKKAAANSDTEDLSDAEEERATKQTAATMTMRYQPLLFGGFTGADELVVVERPWLMVLQNLPPRLTRHRFGA